MIYAIGDIHGQLGMLQTALQRIEADGGADATVVFLGDYVDRGPDSKGVLDLLIKGISQGRNWITLKGNHDRMYSMFMEEYPRNDSQLLVGYHWLHDNIGGVQTLASYGIDVPERSRIFHIHAKVRDAIPPEHIDFMAALPSHYETEELLFVHAGIRPDVPLSDQTEDDLIWIRNEFLMHSMAHSHLVVHGHTPVDRAEHHRNRVNLDTGAGFGRPLTVAVFEGTQCWQLTSHGREDLIPDAPLL